MNPIEVDSILDPNVCIVDAFYAWFKDMHPDYNNEQVTYSVNQMDIDDFKLFVEDVLKEEFPMEGEK
ncbi:MAG: hypothetical protein NC218_03280 [Acetobacter sp.]|nr:hypothetical protein [Acetobacter sp.]